MEKLKELFKKYWYLLPLIAVTLAYIATERYVGKQYLGRLGNPVRFEENHEPAFIKAIEESYFTHSN